MNDRILIAATATLMANPVAHAIRAADHVPYLAWHPINVGLALCLLALGLAWARFFSVRGRSVSIAATWPLLLVAVIAACTAPWSLAPLRSFAWALHLFALTLVASAVAKEVSAETLRSGVLDALVLLLLMSLAFVAFVPEYGLTKGSLYGGAWCGVFASKNHLGLIAALAIVLAVLTRAHVATIALGALTLWGTRSATGLLVASAGVGVALGAKRPWVLALVAALSVCAIVARDRSLTGRTVVWAKVWRSIEERPLNGYGLRAFFESRQDETQLKQEMSEATKRGRALAPSTVVEPKWNVSHAHNGFLQTALDLGVVVTALLLAWIARKTRDAGDIATMAIVAALVAHNMSEVSLLRTWHPEALLWHLSVVHLCASRS